jgi:hypothetical protein
LEATTEYIRRTPGGYFDPHFNALMYKGSALVSLNPAGEEHVPWYLQAYEYCRKTLFDNIQPLHFIAVSYLKAGSASDALYWCRKECRVQRPPRPPTEIHCQLQIWDTQRWELLKAVSDKPEEVEFAKKALGIVEPSTGQSPDNDTIVFSKQ